MYCDFDKESNHIPGKKWVSLVVCLNEKMTSDMCINFSCISNNFEMRAKTFNANLPVELDCYVFRHSARIWHSSDDS